MCVAVSLQLGLAFLMQRLEALGDADTVGANDLAVAAFVVGGDDLEERREGGWERGESSFLSDFPSLTPSLPSRFDRLP